ncbi:nitroreductase [Mycobacterium sp. NPDC006124]|uniref:nitroreductase n=1 Tax=Mycobacterium sp. NPDC006124 TaxID=3156729 RepID=UPI0033BE7CF7
MSPGLVKRTFLRVLAHTVNPVALSFARSGHGPFSALRHVGRRSGTVYDTPLILARVDDGFVAELTYGPGVAWVRNLTATGRGELVVRGSTYQVTGLQPYPTSSGLAAYPLPQRTILRLLRRRDFRLITVAAGPRPVG